MADVCACCGKVLDGYSNVEIDGQIYKLCGNCNFKMKKGKISVSDSSSPMVKNLEVSVKKGMMRKHCKIIAVVGGILGLLVTLFQSWQIRYSMPLALLVLALGGAVAYVTYVMWSSLAEILERMERLEGKAFGGTVRMQGAERKKTEWETDEEETEMNMADLQAGFICPRYGKVQQEGAAFCRQCGMPMQ